MAIRLKKNDIASLFKIEKSNTKKPIDKPVIISGEFTPHQRSRASYLNLIHFYKKVESGKKQGLSSKDFSEIRKEANSKGYDCPYCEQQLTENASIDHKRPYYYGGDSHHSNLQVTCEDCNRIKGALHPEATPKAFSLFKSMRIKLEGISSLEIINRALSLTGLSQGETKRLNKLKLKEELWREERDEKVLQSAA